MGSKERLIERYDLVIVGGGPVGLTLGVAMARSAPGIKIALIDRREMTVPHDMRASAIAAGVRRMFEAIGVWDGMEGAANPIASMKITDSGEGELSRPVLLSFLGSVGTGEPFAHMVPNRATAQALLGAAAGIDIVPPGTIVGFSAQGALAELVLDDGRVFAAPLVVGADGGNSEMRKLAGIGAFTHDYRQSGIVTTIAHALPHADTAYEHFRPAGPFASLPLPGNASSLVWTETPERAAALAAMAPDALAPVIEAVMGSSLGKVEVIDAVQAYPLKLSLAHRFVAPRLALVGDAAHVVHPLAGQGVNLGLKDVAVLCEIVVDTLRLGLDHGSGEVLARYEAARRVDTGLMALATDGLNRLFSNTAMPLRVMRDLGLSAVERMTPLKQAIIGHAAGTGGAKLLGGKRF